jgi:peptidoglycan-associated lipoprotein
VAPRPYFWMRLSLLLAALLVTGCPKKPPPPQPTPEPTPERAAVGVDSMTPTSTPVGRGVTVTLKGWGFAEGSEVFIGARRARGVDIVDTDELTFRATEDLEAGSYDVRVETPLGDVAQAPVPFAVVAPQAGEDGCVLSTVYFEFNEATLADGPRGVLADNARCIEKLGLKNVRLEGHADERGSTIYNLSLGQRRAESVKKYLGTLGADVSSLRTLSYGEERPVDTSWGESSWAKNRRVELVVQ